ncbi:MAG: glycosyltransferase [Rhodospirillaceae bacterium]|nr:glycosyltransferase [Rhodospirillaceae bacterium]
MPRIVIYIGSLDRGGTESHLMRTLPQLRAAGLPVEVFVLSGHGVFIEPLREAGVPVSTPLITKLLPAGRGTLRRLVLLAGLVPELLVRMLWRRPAVAHFFLPTSYCIVGPLAVLMRVPVRLMSRRSLNDYLDTKPSFVTHVEHWLHRRMTAVLGNSHQIVEELADEEDVPFEKLVLLRNGIEIRPLSTEDRRQAARAKYDVSASCVVIAIVANLIPYKGHQDLLRALAMLPPDQDWALLILGGDPSGYRKVLVELVAELGLEERIRFLGETADVPQVLDGCDIGVLCSHEEGFSNALLEYMERALPVVATDVGGNAEAVLDGETGILVPAHAPADLARALQAVVENKDQRKRMGEAGRARVTHEFGLDASVGAYTTLYEALLRGDKVPTRMLVAPGAGDAADG